MPSAVCGWCGVHANMKLVGEPIARLNEDQEGFMFGVFSCDHCGWATLAKTFFDPIDMMNNYGNLQVPDEAIFAFYWDSVEVFPASGASLTFAHVPDDIASAANEAQKCYNFRALRAAVQLARSVVEATAKDKGIKVNNIYPKIEQLHERGFIRPHVRDAAHEIRYLGNDMAHGDFAHPVEADDAALVLTLMIQVLTEVYEDPGKVAEAQARRAARTTSPGS